MDTCKICREPATHLVAFRFTTPEDPLENDVYACDTHKDGWGPNRPSYPIQTEERTTDA